ncbi:nucleoside monophosphate kinase [Candidatus Peregrinibacteria bacterium]|nr:nucleoside monophosphate kinase [Candidatus Peregrinibacteria bacterium]
MDLVLFGIQGSGKGTQAKRLAAEFGYDIFEAGGELRKIAASSSELGKKIRFYIDNGNLVPHEIIMQVVKEAILARPKSQKILFDGIPRDENQMTGFNKIMKDAGRDFRCIHILLDPAEGIRRILGRAKMEGRADDADTAIIERRMKTFVEKTIPVIEKFKREKKVLDIDGMRTVDEVYMEMKKSALDTAPFLRGHHSKI